MVEPKAAILLVYIVADQSGSIGRNIDVLNAGLASLREAVQRETSAAANVRLSVIGFSDTAFTYLEPADVRVLQAMPVLTAQSLGSYAAAFDELAHRIAVDIPSLEAQGYAVHQPAVFFVTGGLPHGDEDWRSVRANLLDETAAPAIVACGIGDADEAVISGVATKPHFAFVSAPGLDTGAEISDLLTSLTQSVISSGQAIASGSAGFHFDKPQGFIFAEHAPIPVRPPPQITTPKAPTPPAPAPAAPESSTIAAASPPQSRSSRTTTIALIAGATALLVTIAGVVIQEHHHSTASLASPTSWYGTQIVLPFTGLKNPFGMAVDAVGNVYIADSDNARVLKLSAGSASQEVLPFTGLQGLMGVAVDAAGTVYASEIGRDGRVLKLAAGSTSQEVLPFTGLVGAISLAVDADGTVYVSDEENDRVLKLRTGSVSQQVLPFTDLRSPVGVAVDSAGTVYVAESNRVLKLQAGSAPQEVLRFTGLISALGVAVDVTGTLYVDDTADNRVLRLRARADSQELLPFSGLLGIQDVAVDRAGNVYVVDAGNNRVLKLPVQ